MKTFRLFFIALAALVIAACSTSDEAKRVADKISDGEILTQADYGVIVNYCGEYARKAQVIQDKIDNLPSDSPEVRPLNAELSELKYKSQYADEFFAALEKATPEEVGSENVRKIDDLGRLIWFTTPSWASVTLDDKAAGLVEETVPGDSNIVAAPVLNESVPKN